MRNLFLSIFITFLSLTVSAQELTFPELSGYKKILNYPVFVPENLWDFINGAADTYLSYGFIDLHVVEYKKGKNVIKAEIYRHTDNTTAFGIYSTERSPSFRFLNLGTQGYIADASINFFKGNYYVKIKTFSKSEKTIQTAESLAVRISDMLDGDSKMPSVLSRFPEIGRKINEETFINESVLGHKFLNKAFKATYEKGPDVFSIYIMERNSADDASKQVETYMTAAGMDSEESGSSGKYVLKDGYNGNVFLAWKDNIIVIISGLSKDQSDIADQYTSEILR
jgi:hypothetical protein